MTTPRLCRRGHSITLGTWCHECERIVASGQDTGGTGSGYHMTPIERGILGEISKIQEELDELKDASKQGIEIMQLVELSDLVGAIKAYLKKYHPSIDLEDLEQMADVTARAFKNGHRKPR